MNTFKIDDKVMVKPMRCEANVVSVDPHYVSVEVIHSNGTSARYNFTADELELIEGDNTTGEPSTNGPAAVSGEQSNLKPADSTGGAGNEGNDEAGGGLSTATTGAPALATAAGQSAGANRKSWLKKKTIQEITAEAIKEVEAQNAEAAKSKI